MERRAKAWKALDLEVEDSLLVHCKRKNQTISPTQNNKTLKTKTPIVNLCSRTRLIPGPARAVQSALQHKMLMTVSVDEDPTPTQEFIRRAVEDPGIEDEDFSHNPWLFAVDFVRNQGLVGDDGVSIGTPLSQIKKGINEDRVSQVVAIVKSITPNGLGDMTATLKDPTGSIDASIHRRVLIEGEFGKDISVGAVLVLHKVAVFSPSRSACYLNIFPGNIVKVIAKDAEISSKPIYPVSLVKHDSVDVESGDKSWMPKKTLSLSQGATQSAKQMVRVNLSHPSSSHGAGGKSGQSSAEHKQRLVMAQNNFERMIVEAGSSSNYNDVKTLLDKQPNSLNQSTQIEGSMKYLGPNVNAAPPSSFGGNGGSTLWKSAVENEFFAVTQDVDRMKVDVGSSTRGSDKVTLMVEQLKPSTKAERYNLVEQIPRDKGTANFGLVPKYEANANHGVKNRSHLLLSSLLQWTDEQVQLLSPD